MWFDFLAEGGAKLKEGKKAGAQGRANKFRLGVLSGRQHGELMY